MSGSRRGWSLLAIAAILTGTSDTWAADRQAPPSVSDAVANDASADEPFLVIPKGPGPIQSTSASAKETRAKAAAEGENATSKTFFGAKTKPLPKRDANVVRVSAADESPPAAPAKGANGKATPEVREDAQFESFETPPPFDSSDAGYHPARVPRKGGPWHIRGSEPAGPRNFNPPRYGAAPPEAIFDGPHPGYQPAPQIAGRRIVSSGPTVSSAPPGPQGRMARANGMTTRSTPQVFHDPQESTFEGPPPISEADAGYHPARVTRKGGGWFVTGSEPAGPRNFAPRRYGVMPQGAFLDDSSSDYQPSSRLGGSSLVGLGATDLSGAEGEMAPTPEAVDYGDGPSAFADDVGMGEAIFNGDEEFAPYVLPGRKWAMIAGAEGLMLRSHFSQATGMTETITTQTGNSTIKTANLIDFNPGYQGAFRAYLGFRNCACGDEIRFTYLNYNGTESLGGTATPNTQFCDFLCNTTPNTGDSVSTKFNLGVNVWDLDFVRPFYFMGACNDRCGPRCHPWDLRWFAGLRAAYINHNITSSVTDATSSTGFLSQSSASNKFAGFGPRMGLQGRKYFGDRGRISVYGRGSGSLMVGNVYQNVISTVTDSSIPSSTVLVDRNSRIIPVAELELGATWWMLPRMAVSGGWMLMSFWDLGLQETGNIGAQPNLNNSNILGFDGFFVRSEIVF
jgi:Legionella pneumophila major outer membrane protein precursor